MHQVRNCEGAHCHRAYSASFSRTPVTRENLRHLLGRAASEVGLRFDFSLFISLCMRSKRCELREDLQKTTSPPQRMHLRWHWGVSFMAFFLAMKLIFYLFFSYFLYTVSRENCQDFVFLPVPSRRQTLLGHLCGVCPTYIWGC